MTAEARRAIAVVRGCIADDRYAISIHFARRMQQRGLFWPDVLTAIDYPHDIRPDEDDSDERPKWIISGDAATGEAIEIVCAIEADESGTVFIMLYWED